MEIKSGKMVKSLEDFFKGYNKYFKGVFFSSLLVNYLKTLSLEKGIIGLEKSQEFWIQKSVICDQIKIEGTNVHDQIAFCAFHSCQACIILQLGDEDCKLLCRPQ